MSLRKVHQASCYRRLDHFAAILLFYNLRRLACQCGLGHRQLQLELEKLAKTEHSPSVMFLLVYLSRLGSTLKMPGWSASWQAILCSQWGSFLLVLSACASVILALWLALDHSFHTILYPATLYNILHLWSPWRRICTLPCSSLVPPLIYRSEPQLVICSLCIPY